MLCPEVMDWFCHELSVYREQPDLLQALPKHLSFSLSVGEVGGKKGLGRPPSSLSPAPPEFPKGKWSQDRGEKTSKTEIGQWGRGLWEARLLSTLQRRGLPEWHPNPRKLSSPEEGRAVSPWGQKLQSLRPFGTSPYEPLHLPVHWYCL